ncbi:MAG: Hsp33 family molecular chaperone HslO [Planctomycetota bacterium]
MESPSNTSPRFGDALVHRFMDDEHSVLLAHADFSLLFDAYLAHATRWDHEPDPLTATMMRQGLAAAALYLSCRPRDEVVGWTISIQNPPVNLFLTGDAGENAVAGRSFVEGVQAAESNRLFVQSSRPGMGVHQSMLEVVGLDILGIFDQYYERSVQSPARFFDYDNGEFAMVLGLPGADSDWMAQLDRVALRSHLQGRVRPLDQQTFRFRCGCRPERMREVLRAAYAGDAQTLFQEDHTVEVECPRCGHRWDVTRAQFEMGD